MSETDVFTVAEALPRIDEVSPRDDLAVLVTWKSGERQVVDLAPDIFKFKIYAPLRENSELFRSVHVDGWGSLIAWGGGEISMSASAVDALAAQVMTSTDFKAFLARHRLTLDAAAAQLGVSRRQAAYFASNKSIPRTVALACAYLDSVGVQSGPQSPA